MSHAPFGTKFVKVGQAVEAGTRFQSSGGLKQPPTPTLSNAAQPQPLRLYPQLLSKHVHCDV